MEKEQKSRAMIRKENGDIAVKFEFDDGDGFKWQKGRILGPHESVEKTSGHFKKIGYTIVDWKDEI